MKTFLLCFIFSCFFFSSWSQDILISGEKYERPYEKITEGIVLFDSIYNWSLINQSIAIPSPFYFFENRYRTTELQLIGASILTGNSRNYLVSSVPLTIESSSYFLRGLVGRAPDDDSSSIGRVLIQFGDTTMTIDYQNVMLQLDNIDLDTSIYLDLRLNFQYRIDFSNDIVTFHFGETQFGPEGQSQIEDLSIYSATAIDVFSSGTTFLFVNGSPDTPSFELIRDEVPDPFPYELSSVPAEGAVFEFRFSSTTSSEVNVLDKGGTIFPNPGNDQFTITYPSSSFDYEIRDALGQMMHEGNASRSTQVSTAVWPAGMYFVSIGEAPSFKSKVWIKTH